MFQTQLKNLQTKFMISNVPSISYNFLNLSQFRYKQVESESTIWTQIRQNKNLYFLKGQKWLVPKSQLFIIPQMQEFKVLSADSMVFVLVSHCPYRKFIPVLQHLYAHPSKTLNFLPYHTLSGRLGQQPSTGYEAVFTNSGGWGWVPERIGLPRKAETWIPGL